MVAYDYWGVTEPSSARDGQTADRAPSMPWTTTTMFASLRIARSSTKWTIQDAGWKNSYYTKPVCEGEIVIFRNEHGFALVKVLRATPRAEGSNAELHLSYELRYK